MIDGELVHSTESVSLASDASIGGDIRSVDSINVARGLPLQTNLPVWMFALYGFLINLMLGAVFLLLLPDFSRAVAEIGRRRPLRITVIGLLALILIPVLLTLLAITVIGIPIAIVGLFVFLFLLWLSTVYGGFAIGSAILDRTDTVNRWLALVLGLGMVFVLGMIPYVGGLILFLVLLFGMGAIIAAVWR